MRLSIAALGLVLTACYTSSEGISPPLDQIYFPVGLTTECDARAGAPPGCRANWLYVANSDFDLQYNAGSIQVLDLGRVRSILDKVYPPDASDAGSTKAFCDKAGLEGQTAAEQILAPGLCHAVDLKTPQDGDAPLVPYTVGIGAFAADVILTTDLSGKQKRLLLPVRGEASLHWIDINEDGSMDCGQDNPQLPTPTCNRAHRVGTDVNENTRNVRMPSEPFGIATSDGGDVIAVTHQTGGGVSLFYQDPVYYEDSSGTELKIGWAAGPKLESVSPSAASQAVAIAAVPESAYVREKRKAWLKSPKSVESSTQADPDPYPPGFLVGFANSPQMELLRAYVDEPSSPSRPFLQREAVSPLRVNSIDTISRGIAFDDTRRRACDEAYCSVTTSEDCKRCANESVGVYVSNRSPGSLFIGTTIPGSLDSGARDIPQFDDAWWLLIGASRVYVGKVLVDGKLETRVFVVCFDQRRIAIYDPKSNTIEDYISTGRGPHAMAFDYYAGDDAGNPAYALAYVGHFTDSYIGVVQLDQGKLRNYAKIVLSLSERVAPRASK